LALLGDLLASAEALGIRGLDATPALRAAEPGAFLNGDIHMTARGHAALAEALAEVSTDPWSMSAPASQSDSPKLYTVRSGDTLTSIARRHQTTVDALRLKNRIDGDLIRVGQTLELP